MSKIHCTAHETVIVHYARTFEGTDMKKASQLLIIIN